MITFYEFDGKVKGAPWNPSTWRMRYSLNYKGLAYKTIWLEYPDIEETMKKIGALPTSKKKDGSPLYTLPAIYDDSTGTAIADSVLIAEYLDETYPSTPKLIIPGTHALRNAFQELFFSKMVQPMAVLLIPDAISLMNLPSAEYFERTRSAHFGVATLSALRVPEEAKEAQWEKVKEGFGGLDALMKKNDVWVMGDTPSFMDFVMASFILWVKILYGRESGEWKKIMTWHGGRWERLMAAVEKYSAVPSL